MREERRWPMGHKIFKTEEHHRRPRSLGGSVKDFNISYVQHEPHMAWHVLFGNLNAMQICQKINSSIYIPKGLRLECRFINGSRVILEGSHDSNRGTKVDKAWKTLFKGSNFNQIVPYINSTWLDSSYHLYIRKI